MIRSSLMKAVFDVLGSHPYLEIEDFQVEEYANEEGEPCLSIRYRFSSDWVFRFHIPLAKRKNENKYGATYYFNCTMCPGCEAVEESVEAQERSGLLEEIKDWTNRLHDDIVTAPVVRQFRVHSSAIEQLRERMEQVPDEPLSRQEILEVRESLDRFKTESTKQLRKESQDKEELRRRVEELNRDVEFLKQTLESMTKRQWGQVLAVRIRKWKDKFSLRQIATGARVLQKLLPVGVTEELDIVADAAEGIADVLDASQEPVQVGSDGTVSDSG